MVSPFFMHDDQQRPLVPFGMADADHGGLRHLGMADREVFEIDRGNPFAARLDHVLGAVGDLHVAVRVHGGDVAGIEEAVAVEDIAAVALEVGARDRGPAHLEAAERLAVPRHRPAGIVLDLHLDHEGRMALLLLDVEPGVAGERGIFRLERAQRAERRHLGHAPGVDDLDAVDVLELLRHRARAGGAADHHALEIGQLAAAGFEVLPAASARRSAPPRCRSPCRRSSSS